MARKNSAHTFITFVTIFAAQGALAANSNSTRQPATTNYARPLSFEPNQGQTNQQVDFLAHGDGYSLFLSHAEAVMVLQRSAPAKPSSQSRPTPLSSATVRLRPVGGNASAKVDALGEMAGKSNYLIGNVPERWHTGIPNYAKVRYGNVYPGVDIIYYGNQRQLEYDFVVSPGSDPGNISLELEGPSKAELDRDGSVVMHTETGDLRWHKPVAYQEIDGSRKLVECAYARSGADRMRFTIGTYDRTKPLIIDPVLEYSTYLGGSGEDRGSGIAVDVHGNAYATGTTLSSDFPTKNAFQKERRGYSDAFVTKFDATGNLVYSTYLGGNSSEEDPGIAVDVHGNAYVTGFTDSFDFPIKNAFQKTSKGPASSGDAFVTKLDAGGDALVYSTYLGGSSFDIGTSIALDAHGEAYVTGYTTSIDFPTKNAFQNKFAGSEWDAFITKFDAAGCALVYSTYLGGSRDDLGFAIAVDVHGDAYVAGATFSTDFPTKNAFQSEVNTVNFPFDSHVFVTKLDAGGDALLYSTYVDGNRSEEALGIAVDAHGNAYITGFTSSTDFPTKNALQNTLKGSSDAFVTKLDAAGDALVYSTYLGGSGGTVGNGIAVDVHGKAYVTGFTSSFDFPTKNAFQNMLKGSNDAFVTKFGANGDALVYSTYLGGSSVFGAEGALDIALDVHGNAYVTGSTGSTDFPTKNAFQPMLGGPFATNAFVTKISAR